MIKSFVCRVFFFVKDLVTLNFTLMVVSVLTKMFYLAEGLAVGVGFGAIGKTTAATFENARYQ